MPRCVRCAHSVFVEREEELGLFRKIHKLRALVGNSNLGTAARLGFEQAQFWRKTRQPVRYKSPSRRLGSFRILHKLSARFELRWLDRSQETGLAGWKPAPHC